MNRRTALHLMGIAGFSYYFSAKHMSGYPENDSPNPTIKPNIILCMADDMGWGDTGYNGHPVLKTPNLNEMATDGIRFDRFYSGAPVCSPTRASCLTGRHPYRMGIYSANVGHMPAKEMTLAEVFKTQNYTTGHFGKWHLGHLSRDPKYNPKPNHDPQKHYSPPWENGFDECFSTQSCVPTWNPTQDVTPPHKDAKNRKRTDDPWKSPYWQNGKRVTQNLKGDDSRIIMDRAIPFIQKAAAKSQPFFTVIWFHTPHGPVIAGPDDRKRYANEDIGAQHYYGAITAMDRQIGRLRKELENLGISDNTILWFCSDNGPAGRGTAQGANTSVGSAGPFRGRKASLFEGGIRVPGILEWPERLKSHKIIKTACSTHDYYPTLLDVLDINITDQPKPIDGINIWPIIQGKQKLRSQPVAFEFKEQIALIDDRYKIISQDGGKTFMLFDLRNDPGEKQDISQKHINIVHQMKKTLEEWQKSCKNSLEGKDY